MIVRPAAADRVPALALPRHPGRDDLWERWDSQRPDGTLNPGWMTSFNHYALGAVGDWLHRVVAGLAPGSPGYRHTDFALRADPRLTSAAARHRSPWGELAIEWTVAGDSLDAHLTVPAERAATWAPPAPAAAR